MKKADIEKAKKHWNKQASKSSPKRSWRNSPTILKHANKLISGDPEKNFPYYLKDKYFKKPCEAGLSLGSGTGEFDREIMKLGICERLDSIDFSKNRIKICREGAASEKLNIQYVNENIEAYDFGFNKYDVVFAKSVLHHLENLELIFEKIKQCLKSGGFFIVDDFFGPSRFQWTEQQLNYINKILNILPPLLKIDVIDNKTIRKNIKKPSISSMIESDPTEAIRSEEILALIRNIFTVLEMKEYGGTIYHQLFNRIMGNFDETNEKDLAIINLILFFEDELIKNKILTSDYVVLILKK